MLFFFFFNDTATTEIYTLSLHDALPISVTDTGVGMTEDVRSRVFDPFFTTKGKAGMGLGLAVGYGIIRRHEGTVTVESEPGRDRKSTRLNSSHANISYAVFCLKKKTKNT